MSPEQAVVKEFHEKFGLPVGRVVVDTDDFYCAGLYTYTLYVTSEYRRALRVALINEEASEFAEATINDDVPGMVDALCDLLYVVYETAVEMGVDLEPIFREVHRANMAKVGGSTRPDGKILKPEGWEPPNVERELRKQVSDE